jgi:carbohydrate kinase (thermoresistant glucokinase family)
MIIVLMGVTGCGKTTVGMRLSQKLHCPFYDADDFHSPQNKEMMSRGIGLSDGDRGPWLEGLASKMKVWDREHPLTLLACSALKESYRKLLAAGLQVQWVYLKGERRLIQERLAKRQGHYAKADLLESQWTALEEPRDSIVSDIGRNLDTIVEELFQTFKGN